MAKTVIGRNLPLYKGNYDSNTTYDIYDVVVLNGSSYVSKKTNNLGNNPETNAEYWQLLAKSGAKGDKGNKGEKGDTPVAGVDYYTNEERERFKNAVIDASKQDIENLTETKITEFNTNATEKTNTFNSNSTQKISAYNDNHTAKLSEYNRTAEKVINSFDIVSEYIDAEHDTIVTEESTETTINDSAKWYGKIDVKGRTEQEQYSGKNLFNVPLDYSITGYEQIDIYLPAGNYILSCDEVVAGGSTNPVIAGLGNWFTVTRNMNRTITLEEDVSKVLIYSNGYSATNSQEVTSKISNLMIRNASITDDTYEPYCGGQASPSPEYPQDIKNVEGNINFKICNKNLCNRVANNYYNPTTGTIQNGTDARYRTFVADYAPTGNYIFSTNIQNCYILRAWVDNVSVQVNAQSNSYQFSVTKPGKVMICVRNADTTEITENVIAQIEKNTVATDYEQNSQQTVTFQLADGQKLMKNDYLADDGIHHLKGQRVIEIKSITTNSDGYAMSVITIPNKIAKTNNYLKCDRAITANSGKNRVWENQLNITIIGDENDTLETMKQKYNGAIVEYELAEEVVDPYTPAQQEAYNQLQKLMLNHGTNHVWTETDGLNPNIKVTYKKSNRIKNENEIENIKNAIISMGGNI